MMTTNSSIFQEFLVEEFEKRTQSVDIVGTKRKYFKSLRNKAHDALKEEKYTDAKQYYFDIIEYLRNEPYHDELNLSPDMEFCIECCFCYSSVMDPSFCQEKTVITILAEELITALQDKYANRLFPKYLKVLLSVKRKDWVTTLYWCDKIKTNKVEEANYKSVDFFKELLPSQSEINANIEIYEEEAFYGYGQRLANRLMHIRNDQQCNMYDENFISNCDQCNRVKIQQYILRDQPTIKKKIKFEEVLNKFVDLYQRISKCNFTDLNECDLYDKIQEIEDLVTTDIKKKMEKKADDKFCMVQTQTDKIKNVNRLVQTEGVKCKSIDVQVNLESQTLNTLLDIKSKLLVNQERKDTINKLNKKISELNEKLTKEVNKRKDVEEEYQRKLTKQELEINTLKNLLNESDIERKQEREKNFSLQKLLVEQTNDKFNMQRNIYKTFERKSIFMVNYLGEINQFLTPSSIPTNVEVKQNIDIWDSRLKKIQEDLKQLNIFYKKIRVDMIKSDQFNFTWPDLPELPGDEDNVVFVSFKPAIKNIIDIEGKLLSKPKMNIQGQQPIQMLPTMQYYVQQPYYPMQNSSFYIGPRTTYPNLASTITVSPNKAPQQYSFPRHKVPGEVHMQHQQSLVEQKPNLNENLKKIKSTESINKTSGKDIFSGNVENPNNMKNGATSSKSVSENYDKSYQKKDKVLFEYVLANCFGATEIEVTLAMLQVMEDNEGTLSKLSKEQIVDEVKMVLRMKRQSAWVAPKSPHVDWKNDHSEHNCAICFEEFSLSKTYTLQCQHEYHKECIRKWLKTSSICPICRVHSVIDDEFPPLH